MICPYCHEKFAEVEPRITQEGQTYHIHCNKKRIRNRQLRDLFTQNSGTLGLKVVPHRKVI